MLNLKIKTQFILLLVLMIISRHKSVTMKIVNGPRTCLDPKKPHHMITMIEVNYKLKINTVLIELIINCF